MMLKGCSLPVASTVATILQGLFLSCCGGFANAYVKILAITPARPVSICLMSRDLSSHRAGHKRD